MIKTLKHAIDANMNRTKIPMVETAVHSEGTRNGTTRTIGSSMWPQSVGK